MSDAAASAAARRDDPKLNMALVRGLEVLRAFRQGELYLGNTELARRTGIPKASVSRLTYTLCALGYLNFDEAVGKYAIAPGILALGYAVLANTELPQLARPLMARLAAETNSVVGLSVRDGLHMIYLEHARERTAIRRDTSIGYRVPIAGSTMGWACLAGMMPQPREATLGRLREATAPADWPAAAAKIDAAMADVWRRGFCVSFGDIDPVVNAVGVPLLHGTGAAGYAMNCVAPAYDFTAQRMVEEIGPKLLRLTDELRGLVAGSAPPRASG